MALAAGMALATGIQSAEQFFHARENEPIQHVYTIEFSDLPTDFSYNALLNLHDVSRSDELLPSVRSRAADT